MIDLHLGDCLSVLRSLPDGSVRCCVTSPPYYGLRDYGVDGQIGLEPTPDAYVSRMVEVFREVRRVLVNDGTLWLNLGDSYAGGGGGNYGSGLNVSAHQTNPSHLTSARRLGLKPKDLIGIPWRVVFALQADGWYLRSDIIWHKPNPMPESVRDRPTKSHEYVFLLSKQATYYYDADAVREPGDKWHPRGSSPKQHAGQFPPGKTWADRKAMGHRGHTDLLVQAGVSIPSLARHPNGRNRRSVWSITPSRFKGAHFAVMPPALVEPCIRAGSAIGDTVLDPFVGSGTVPAVALSLGRSAIGIDLNPAYLAIARRRIDAALAAQVPA